MIRTGRSGSPTDLQVDEFTGVAALPPPPPLAATTTAAARPASAGCGDGQNENRGHRPESAARYTSHLISSHFGLAFHAGDGTAARRETVYLPSPADEHKGSTPPTGTARTRRASPRRNGTPRGRRRGGRGLWILRCSVRIQSRGPKTLPQGMGRLAGRRGPTGWDDDLLPGLAAEPDRRRHPRPVEHGPRARQSSGSSATPGSSRASSCTSSSRATRPGRSRRPARATPVLRRPRAGDRERSAAATVTWYDHNLASHTGHIAAIFHAGGNVVRDLDPRRLARVDAGRSPSRTCGTSSGHSSAVQPGRLSACASTGMTTRSPTTPAPGSSSIRPRRSSRSPSCTPRTPSGSGTSAPPSATARSPSGSSGTPAGTPRRDELEMLHVPAYIDSVAGVLRRGRRLHHPVDAGRSPASWDAALAAAGTALEATAAVLDGDCDQAYALVRPPGHHAQPDRADGYCLFSNAALAPSWRAGAASSASPSSTGTCTTETARRSASGTGPTCSPSRSTCGTARGGRRHPQTGAPGEVGAGDGAGRNVNVELPVGTGDEGYRRAMARVVEPIVDAFGRELIVIACGQDASQFDPNGRMCVTMDGFRDLGAAARALADRHCDGRMVLVQEGGYGRTYSGLLHARHPRGRARHGPAARRPDGLPARRRRPRRRRDRRRPARR